MKKNAVILDAAAEAAIGWLVVLNSGAVSEAERTGFAAWLVAAPGHREAWARLAGPLEGAFGPARAAVARSGGNRTGKGAAESALAETLARADAFTRARRRLLRDALGLGGLATGAALLAADRWVPLATLAADLRTGTGERRDWHLPDGSRLTLDARSAADIDFGPGRRTVTLRQGALIVQAAPADAHGGTPLVVRTHHGQVRALGTRFVVRLAPDASYAGLLEHRIEVRSADGQRLQLAEGQGARFGTRGVARDPQAPEAASGWQRGLLEAHDQPLGEVVEALRAYHAGFIRISPRAAALRVYGSYALDDTGRALAALAETLPIDVRVYRRGWLVMIE